MKWILISLATLCFASTSLAMSKMFAGRDALIVYGALQAAGVEPEGLNRDIRADLVACDANGVETNCQVVLPGNKPLSLAQRVRHNLYLNLSKLPNFFRLSPTSIRLHDVHCYDVGVSEGVLQAVCSLSTGNL